MESFPVQANARLSHDAGGDRCKALVRRTLRINLAPLRELYQRAYRTTSGKILIQLSGTPPILYSF